jgi:hypothetical protein
MADKVYEGDEIKTGFLSDQVAGLDNLVKFLIDAIRSAENFKKLQETVNNTLAEVKVMTTYNVEEFLRRQISGYALMIKPLKFSGPADWDRDDIGFPIIYPTQETAEKACPPDFEVIRILDLGEEAVRRADK